MARAVGSTVRAPTTTRGTTRSSEASKHDSFESQLAQGAVWVGSPDSISEQIAAYNDAVGEFEIASMQVNFAGLPYDVATRSLDLFGREVLPRFSTLAATTPS